MLLRRRRFCPDQQAAEDREELRGDVAALEARVTRLEQECDDRRD